MSKRLVVCCDGTWNTPDQHSRGAPSPTNVTKLALAIAPRDPKGCEQRMFYHRGVGTSRYERVRGGAFGLGLARDVRDTYRFLVENYEPGDALFFFGFSRGAFTARSTAGFVRNCGILRREYADKIGEAYSFYRGRSSTSHPRSIEATLFRSSYSHEPDIHFIGVWDTVGALGIPLNGLRLVNLFNRRFQFHDTELSTRVHAAFQALAIDEKRGPFRPAVWKQAPDAPKSQHVEQVWFAGVHCDIGGGYDPPGLSDITLPWMVQRAQRYDLYFDPKAFTYRDCAYAPEPDATATLASRTSVHPDPLQLPENSRTLFYRLIPPYIRPIGATDWDREAVASTAVELHEAKPHYYEPKNLVAYLGGPHHTDKIDVPTEWRSRGDASDRA
ncbi:MULTISPECIES: DUF2235 domain-containing protein [Mycobacteriaceae]|uniref:DUF2235 domain-containing protein n=1 Tax=Mycolicibacterium mucogenicum DSM 44124 TaxID=1226753 RepID=A0A8H2PIB9_MYCMU|nr:MULTISPECIES: DUF2235 domain-containing protein [Mycobacteriaceae]KAB7756281.1 hypothetical protein MMUC44124_17035 [Mycolicibacterium mucogenicum DSM 44124]QPG68066.1 DUF2235 domain-containing protein [Mycolicibacterium mucogenicum DSM 44124]SEB26184.1 Uncharacterized alpha/beta hydrolase domain [Mycobacterium sp. 283mftsu]